MNNNLQLNEDGLNLIKQSEGFRSEAYLCPAGVPTIGYGHTDNVSLGDTITEENALQLLIDELKYYEDGVKDLVEVDLNDNQFSALVSFAYNVGIGSLEKSTLLKKLNKKDYIGAAEEFARWNKGGGKVLPGLVIRREKEKQLFIK